MLRYTNVLTSVNTLGTICVVTKIQPKELLDSPLTGKAAPWCAVLDNLDLGIVLATPPWIVGAGLRRADIERQLGVLASSLPIGNIYFQRVNRAVATLESRAMLSGSGHDRDRRFALTPEGFAALILNLHVLRSDPTLDGSEFEFKLELVAHFNLAFDRLLSAPPNIVFPPSMQSFFERLERLTVLGTPVLNMDLIENAFNVRRLIAEQRSNVIGLKSQAEARLAQTHAMSEFFRTADLSQLNVDGLGEHAALLRDTEVLQEVVRTIATSGAPQLSARGQVIRYESYLAYLAQLEAIYSSEPNVVDINMFRRRIAGLGG
jgi:hypothetical protein